MTEADVYADAAIVGAISGLRSMSGPALVTRATSSVLVPQVAPRFFSHPATLNGSLVLALGELVADKLPNIPSRISLAPLIGRALAGGYSGGLVSHARKRSVYVGAAVGALAAIGGAYAGYHLRRFLNRNLRLPGIFAGLAEDAIMAGAASLALRRLRSA